MTKEQMFAWIMANYNLMAVTIGMWLGARYNPLHIKKYVKPKPKAETPPKE